MSDPRVESCRGKAFAILLLVFLGGAVSGAVGVKVYNRQMAVTEKGSHEAVEHLRVELGLNGSQVRRVQSILDECIMKEADHLTQIKGIKDDGRERILKLLNEQQRRKFQQVLHEAAGP